MVSSSSGTGDKTEETCYECNLSYDVVFRQPSDLALANHIHRLDTLNGSCRRIEGAESLTGSHPAFDRSVILLHDVVQVAYRAASATSSEFSAALELSDGLSL